MRAVLDTSIRTVDPPRLGAVRPEVALELGRLLHPDLIEVRGCVLLPWAYEPSNFETWWQSLNGDRPRIEGVLNHLHLWDVFDTEVDDAVLLRLADTIAQSWREAAASKFPGRRFEIAVAGNDQDYGPTIVMQSFPLSDTPGPARQ